MTNKSMKPTAAQPRPMTEDERKAQALRAFLQERKTLVQGIAFNAAGNPSVTTDTTPETFAKWVISAADELMKQLYTRDEQAENTEK
jgi:hypothetical protein